MDRGKKKMEKEMMGENKEFQQTVRLAVGHSSNLRFTSFRNGERGTTSPARRELWLPGQNNEAGTKMHARFSLHIFPICATMSVYDFDLG